MKSERGRLFRSSNQTRRNKNRGSESESSTELASP